MRLLELFDLTDIAFLDIETSNVVEKLEVGTPLFESWKYKKGKDFDNDEDLIQHYYDTSALYSEFGRVVCISMGIVMDEGFYVKTFNDLDEGIMIKDFFDALSKLSSTKKVALCGHAIKQFDIPYIAHRAIANNIPLHKLVDTSGLKPWELDWILDTKELWQGTGYNRASLLGIVTMLGLPSPKNDLKGADVPAYFWKNPEGNIQRISEYCERDVLATCHIIQYLKNLGEENNGDKLIDFMESPEEVVFEDPTLLEELFDGARYGAKEKKLLKAAVMSLSSKEERSKAYEILNAITSTAKGKKTKFTKTHVKALIKEIEE